ncbi:MAG: hypothetical protein JSS43_24120 [Proteobacteria bacterium]|nr:hypothetical protein [Pseudomonadota bacterium]
MTVNKLGRWAAAAFIGLAAPAALAAEPTFGDLLARAQAEIAAGRHFAPPGDNAAETFMAMIDALPQATPEQLSAFEALLQQQRTVMDRQQAPAAAAGAPVVASSIAPATVTTPEIAALGEPRLAVPFDSAGLTQQATPPSAPAESRSRGVPPQPVPDATPEPDPVAAKPAMLSPAPAPAAPVPRPNETALLTPPSASPPAPPRDQPRIVPPAPKAAPLAPAVVAQLFKRGQAAEAQRDISAARRYYMTAAEHDYPGAATALARLYDPAFLQKNAIGGIAPDQATAQYWYGRAKALIADPAPSHPNTLSAR